MSVSRFLAMTFASGTAPPCSSVILPDIVALVVWAVADVMKGRVFMDNNNVSALVIKTADRMTGNSLLLVDIFSSRESKSRAVCNCVCGTQPVSHDHRPIAVVCLYAQLQTALGVNPKAGSSMHI